ncbi:MAG: class I SAM-dependent methyltransferase [Bdellovibrionota bacterium]
MRLFREVLLKVFAAVVFIPTAIAYAQPTDGCEDLLKKPNVVMLDLRTESQTIDTIAQLIEGIYLGPENEAKTVSDARVLFKYATGQLFNRSLYNGTESEINALANAKLPFRRVMHQLFSIYGEFRAQFKRRMGLVPLSAQEQTDILYFIHRLVADPLDSYLHSDTKAFYVYYLSGLQRFASTIVAAYGIQHSDLAYGSKPSILELGAGAGDSTSSLLGLIPNPGRVIVTDNSPVMLQELRRRKPEIHTLVHDFRLKGDEKLPFLDKEFDLIFGFSSFTQSLDRLQLSRLLFELRRVGKPGGSVIVDLSLGGPHKPFETETSLDRALDFFEEHGFQVQRPPWLSILWNESIYYPIVLKIPN